MDMREDGVMTVRGRSEMTQEGCINGGWFLDFFPAAMVLSHDRSTYLR